jgi:hypothetical protein
MSERATLTATPGPGGICLAVYGQGGTMASQVGLSSRQALLLGLDLITLAAPPLFTLGDTPNSPADDDRGNPVDRSVGTT